MFKVITTILFFLLTAPCIGQDTLPGPIQLSGYAEVYYSYDFGEPANHLRPPFFYSFNRHNELNLNLGFLKASYKNEVARGNFALMAGTYTQYNLANEPGLLKNVFEANAGLRLSKKRNLWLDAGILPSHIGFESAIGKDCWNLTRSMLADNSPYYEAGARISFLNKPEKVYLALLYLNGWQRIMKIPGNQTPSFGSQVTLKPFDKFTFNWSTFIGNDHPDSVRSWRVFNNLYVQSQLGNRLGIILGLDYGMEQKVKHSQSYFNWFSPVAIIQLKTSKKTRISFRGEYYSDIHQVIINTETSKGFEAIGYSTNFDYWPNDNCVIRLETRGLSANDQIFLKRQKLVKENYFITGSIGLTF